jgi:hypothetical protein
MVREGAIELAVINGRLAQEVSKSGWELSQTEIDGRTEGRYERNDSLIRARIRPLFAMLVYLTSWTKRSSLT